MVAAVSVVLPACSPELRSGAEDAGEDPSRVATSRETTATPGAASEDAENTIGASRSWDYVALGDSLAAGVSADRGYVGRYADHLRGDTGAKVRVTNLGVSGQTSAQLLDKIRNDPSTREALRGAEVVTLNIGINDLARAGRSYGAGTCGGADEDECLREVVDRVGDNWDAITAELLELRPADGTVVRGAGLGYTPNAGGVFEP